MDNLIMFLLWFSYNKIQILLKSLEQLFDIEHVFSKL